MSREPPVELFVPPDVVAAPTLPQPPTPPQPELPSASLVLGMATVDHSGRVHDRVVLGALGWRPGEHTQISARARALLVRRVDRGGAVIDTRGRVFLPIAARAQLEIEVDERLLLVAIPERALLIVHPLPLLAALLAGYYAHGLGVLDDDT